MLASDMFRYSLIDALKSQRSDNPFGYGTSGREILTDPIVKLDFSRRNYWTFFPDLATNALIAARAFHKSVFPTKRFADPPLRSANP